MATVTSNQDWQLSAGDVCEGYRIVSLIAAGGMGDVYEAIHEASGMTVAFKCLKVRRNKEDARARMKMEAVVLSELKHANLVHVYDAGVTDAGMVWIAMERLNGQTLRELLHRAKRLPIPDALYYASEIADGADAVHEVNVIHRDLKPENVFITDKNVVKVLDLGTGKFTGYGLESTAGMRVMGTTAYMSPEQIKGLRVDARSDVYALGLIVYEMVSGRHALSRDGSLAALPRAVEQIALLQLQMQPKPLTDVMAECPAYISSLVANAIAKERDRRYPNMTTFSRELRAARKRFIAENRFADGAAERLRGGEGLREKFGAPPRGTSNAPPAPAVAARVVRPDLLHTESQGPPDFSSAPASGAPREPTVELSSSELPALPPSLASDRTDRVPPPDEVRNRTTHTNPLGFFQPTDLTPEPLSVPDARRRPLFGPGLRRIATTLGLGALIGIPPAVLAVFWNAHQRAPVASEPPPPPPQSAPIRLELPMVEPPTVASARPEPAEAASTTDVDARLASSPPPSAKVPGVLARPSREKTGGPRSVSSAPTAKTNKDPASKGDMPASGL
ncbi:MAG TPA: protein kinase [Polyangiaceae bacterium]